MKLPFLVRPRVETWSVANLNVSSTDPTCKLIHQRTPKMETKAKTQDTPSHDDSSLTSRYQGRKFHALDFREFKQCPPLTRENQRNKGFEKFEAHNAKRECRKMPTVCLE